MFKVRILATALCACAIAVPAFAQEPIAVHHATDVVMGAGFGIASARTVTMTLAKSTFNLGVQPQVGGASINFTKIYK